MNDYKDYNDYLKHEEQAEYNKKSGWPPVVIATIILFIVLMSCRTTVNLFSNVTNVNGGTNSIVIDGNVNNGEVIPEEQSSSDDVENIIGILVMVTGAGLVILVFVMGMSNQNEDYY